MSRGGPTGGVFTTDLALVVRSWDRWVAEVTGILEADAVGRPLAELAPELEERGHLERLRRAAADGAVEVMAPAFHRYLLPCPPREPSAHFTRMQQHVTIAPLRAGDAIIGVSVTLEDVTARLDRERELAARLASGDEGVRLEAARALADAEGPAGPLAGALGDPSWRVRRAAADGLARAADDAAVDALLTAVRDRHRDPAVLNAALSGLARSGQDVVPPLLALLEAPGSDADVRTYAALALGLVRHRRAVPALMRALGDPDDNVRFHAVEALGRIGAREAADAVAAVAETRDFAVAFAALDALAMIGEPSVAHRLVPLLDDDLLQTAAAEALGRIGREDAAAPLAALLGRPGAPVAEIAGALAALHRRLEEDREQGELVAGLARAAATPDAVRRLAAALASARGPDRAALVTVLGWLEGDGVERALAGALADPLVRRAAGETLGRRGAAALEPLLGQLASDDEEARKAAAAALGRVGAGSAVPALAALLDEDPELAVVAAGALGHIGDGRAFEPLLARLDHPHAAVRQAAVAALSSIGHPEMAGRVRALLGDPSPHVREAAAKLAGYFGYPECVEPLLALRDDPDEGVRRTAVEQLAHLDDPRAVQALRDALAMGPPGVRAAAARALAHVETVDALPGLLAASCDADPWVRYYSARSLGRHRASDAIPVLIGLATADPVTPVRIAAVEAIAETGDGNGLAQLRPLVLDPDAAVARPALLALGAARGPETRPALVDALRADDRDLRLAALAALGRRAEAGAAAEVAAVAHGDADPVVRAAALETLARLGGPNAVAALIELAAEPRNGAAVVASLAGLDEADLQWLGRGLDHADVEVRCVVVEALSRSRHRAAAPLLAAALDDADPTVRGAAAQALERVDLRAADARVARTLPG